MNSNLKREQNLRNLRRAADATLTTEERAELEAAIADYAGLTEQDKKLRVMLARWEQQYGPNDGCVRALKAVLGGVA